MFKKHFVLDTSKQMFDDHCFTTWLNRQTSSFSKGLTIVNNFEFIAFFANAIAA